jgi:excisionase family DNA binding protein
MSGQLNGQDTLTAPQAAEKCGVTSKTIHRWIKAGYFPGARKGPGRTSGYRIPRGEVEAFVEETAERVRDQVEAGVQAAVREQGQSLSRAAHAVLAKMMCSLLERLRGPVVLVVEEDPNIAKQVAAVLAAVGLVAHVVDSSASAMATLAAVAPALVVLSLPGDGRRLEVPELLGTPQLAQVRVLVLADPDDARVCDLRLSAAVASVLPCRAGFQSKNGISTIRTAAR